MNDAGAGPRAELDLEALARGDRVAADVLMSCPVASALTFLIGMFSLR